VRNPQAIGYSRTRGRTTPWPHRNAHTARGSNKILYNQKITRIPGSLNCLQLKVETLSNLVGNFLITLCCTNVCQMTQVSILNTLAAIDRKSTRLNSSHVKI